MAEERGDKGEKRQEDTAMAPLLRTAPSGSGRADMGQITEPKVLSVKGGDRLEPRWAGSLQGRVEDLSPRL